MCAPRSRLSPQHLLSSLCVGRWPVQACRPCSVIRVVSQHQCFQGWTPRSALDFYGSGLGFGMNRLESILKHWFLLTSFHFYSLHPIFTAFPPKYTSYFLTSHPGPVPASVTSCLHFCPGSRGMCFRSGNQRIHVPTLVILGNTVLCPSPAYLKCISFPLFLEWNSHSPLWCKDTESRSVPMYLSSLRSSAHTASQPHTVRGGWLCLHHPHGPAHSLGFVHSDVLHPSGFNPRVISSESPFLPSQAAPSHPNHSTLLTIA